jgi:hypothetical protein
MEKAFTVETRGTMVDGDAGDYLCLDAEGKAYVCSQSLFEKVWRILRQESVVTGA